MDKIKNWIIKKAGGFTSSEIEDERKSAMKIGNAESLGRLKSVIVSQRASISEDRLGWQAGFIDYICVQVGIPKIYNNGSYEKFLSEQ